MQEIAHLGINSSCQPRRRRKTPPGRPARRPSQSQPARHLMHTPRAGTLQLAHNKKRAARRAYL